MAEPAGLPTVDSINDTARDEMLGRMPYYWSQGCQPGAVLYRFFDALGLPMAEARRILELWPKMHAISDAWDFALDLVSSNVGGARVDGESDTWLRERTQFIVFLQHITGSIEEAQKAVAWFVGFRRQNINWRTEYLPLVQGYLNRNPFWPYQDVVGVGKDLRGYMLVTFPWTLVDVWQGDMWRLIGDASSDFPWSTSTVEKQVIYGHHLLLDLRDLAIILAMAGMKLAMWGIGSSYIGTSNGAFPWQTTVDARTTGPVELHGVDGVYDHYTEPSGCLILNNTDEPPNINKWIFTEDDFDPDSGKRLFTYGTKAVGGGAQWP